MRIGLQTWGSEGDIQPFLALAAGLVKAGHQVKLCITEVAERDYTGIAAKNGFEIVNAPNPALPTIDIIEKMGQAFKEFRDPAAQLKIINRYFLYPAEKAMFDAAKELCATSDLVVRHIFCYPTQIAAELAHIPVATLYPIHNILPNPHQPPFGAVNLGRWSIPLWWKLAQWLINKIFLKQINHLRQSQDLQLIDDVLTQGWSNKTLNLIAASSAICRPQINWPKNFKVCGFLNGSGLDQSYQSLQSLQNSNNSQSIGRLDPEVTRFLQDKEPPIYFTFGSMFTLDERSWRPAFEVWSEVVRDLGVRAIFQIPLPKGHSLSCGANVLIVPRTPHDLVVPFCALVMHHGGAGTSQSSLISGCPSVVVAHIADQPFWGSELKRINVSPGFILRKDLSKNKLAKYINMVLKNPKYRENALRLSKIMKAEKGVDLAINALTDLADSAHSGTLSN